MVNQVTQFDVIYHDINHCNYFGILPALICENSAPLFLFIKMKPTS